VRRPRSDPKDSLLRKDGPLPALCDGRPGRDPLRRKRHFGPAGDARMIRLVTSTGSGSVLTFDTGTGPLSGTPSTTQHVAVLRGRRGFFLPFRLCPLGLGTTTCRCVQATSGCPVPTFRDVPCRLSEDDRPDTPCWAGWTRLQGFEPRKSPCIHPPGVTLDDWSRSSLGISPP
jgi:hypothetical protein